MTVFNLDGDVYSGLVTHSPFPPLKIRGGVKIKMDKTRL